VSPSASGRPTYSTRGFTKDVRVKVPESVKIVIRGKTACENATAKDFILKLLSLDYIR
jgi:homoaconitase/3-isopropylmalate dehydratase large subunit